MDRKQLTLEMSGANLEYDKTRKPASTFAGLPVADWNGVYVFQIGTWEKTGLKLGDVLTSIDGVRLSETQMYCVLAHHSEATDICWRSEGMSEETCAKVPK